MKRQDFLRAGISAALLTGLSSGNLFSQSGNIPDLVAVKDGEPEIMFDKGIAALGGIGRFVKSGSKIVVKPNIGWAVGPERGANTNPGLIRRIIEHCYNAGAKKVYVFDHTCNEWSACYQQSGIEQQAKAARAMVVPGNDISYYEDVEIKNGVKLGSAKVHEVILEADAVINVPVLKHHSSAGMTACMKNLMGVVWDRGVYHRSGLHQCIADYCLYTKPVLNVVDAYRVMIKNGPRGISEGDVEIRKSMILSSDIVAADSAAARIFGVAPDQIGYISKAVEHGLGEADLSRLNISRISV